MSILTDGFGTIVAGLEAGGGGGGTVIPDGGTVTGTYDGNVLCEGAVTVTGNLTVNGSMIVRGDFTNDGGWEVTIRGDLHAQGIYFDKDDTSTPQQDFSVDGDLLLTYMEFRQCDGASALLRVGGDLIGTVGGGGTSIFAQGENDGSPGLNVVVYGTVMVFALDVNGGDGNAVSAGNGGSVTVYGDLVVGGYADLSGGASTDADAGFGGTLYVYGDIVAGPATIYLYGGEATNGNAGNAGTIDCEGDLLVGEVAAYGGDCTSDNEVHRSGSGGNIYLAGSLVSDGFINVSGGDRFGTLSLGATGTSPSAGTIDVKGSITADDIDLIGGGVSTINFAPHFAGDGGYLYVKGVLTIQDDLEVYGGSADVGTAGNGGNLYAESSVYVDDDFEFQGGNASNGNGGNGGFASVRGNLYFADGRLWGGNATNGNGGIGANLYVEGNLYCNQYISAEGGDSNSTNEVYVAGSAGSFNVKCDFHYEGDDGELYMVGGSRYGATTVAANTGITGATGGFITVGGDLIARENINLIGGSTTTDYPNVKGGNGGGLSVYGAFTGQNVMLYAGQGTGSDGGAGGTFEGRGFTKFYDLSVAGGPSYDSVVGGDAAAAGSAGNVSFQSGGVGFFMFMGDGGAGTAATASVRFTFNGLVTLHELDMADRPDSWIVAYNPSIPAMLKVNSLPTKQTLNNEVGVETANISATLDGSMFITGLSSTWYAVAGVAV